ncbi:unnamed protein product [Dracunculus medinensis]|uniref:Transmembrane protein n=1 Tax=Dracunculus medinensis TaxID=318479 RepID=A0A0N4UHJ8_DRAME|nr:unnamed protein product [Dracunculus medinensis]
MINGSSDKFFLSVIRVFIVVVALLGIYSILSTLVLISVASITLRFFIVGIALLLLGVAILAWWLISTDLIESRQTLSNVYLQSLRRTDSVSYLFMLKVTDINAACLQLRTCYQLDPLPQLTLDSPWVRRLSPTNHCDSPPPIYSTSQSELYFPSFSPPPDYEFHENQQTVLRNQLLQIIDCSKAEPIFSLWNQRATSF